MFFVGCFCGTVLQFLLTLGNRNYSLRLGQTLKLCMVGMKKVYCLHFKVCLGNKYHGIPSPPIGFSPPCEASAIVYDFKLESNCNCNRARALLENERGRMIRESAARMVA